MGEWARGETTQKTREWLESAFCELREVWWYGWPKLLLARLVTGLARAFGLYGWGKHPRGGRVGAVGGYALSRSIRTRWTHRQAG